MGFKFFKQEDENDISNQLRNELIAEQMDFDVPQVLSTDNRPAVFLSLNRNRDTIDETEWTHTLRRQRVNLIEYMWEQGMISHTIISQDANGFTIRTEINF